MFVRTRERANGKVTILIVESVRSGGKVHQKTLRTVATVLPAEADRFLELAEHIRAKMEVERKPSPCFLSEHSQKWFLLAVITVLEMIALFR